MGHITWDVVPSNKQAWAKLGLYQLVGLKKKKIKGSLSSFKKTPNCPPFEQTRISFTQVCIVPKLVEMGLSVLEKKVSEVINVYSLPLYYGYGLFSLHPDFAWNYSSGSRKLFKICQCFSLFKFSQVGLFGPSREPFFILNSL